MRGRDLEILSDKKLGFPDQNPGSTKTKMGVTISQVLA